MTLNLFGRYITIRACFALVVSLILSTSCISTSDDRYAISDDGSSINYSVAGSGDPTLVFIHGGLGCDKEIWNAQVSHFNKEHKVVSVSLAGHGKSDSTRSNYTMESFGKDVSAVANDLDLNEVILIGHSMGGLVCIEAALILRNETIGIIGLDCLNEFEQMWSGEDISGTIDWFATNTSVRVHRYVSRMFHKSVDSNLVASTAEKLSHVNPRILHNELENWFNYQNNKFLSSVQRIDIPITCIQNGDNVITDETNRKYNPGYKGVKLDSLLHMFLVAYPDQANQEIESMIEYIVSHQ